MELLIHPLSNDQLVRVAATGGGSVLLHGPIGVGKRTVALEIARRLNCQGCNDRSCKGCQQAAVGNHPNITVVGADAKGKIGIEAVHNMQHHIKYREYQSEGHRVIIFVQADRLTIPAQNALLKTLEEPPIGTTMILTAMSPSGLLDTIVSRCRPIYLPAPAVKLVQEMLGRQALPNAAEAARLSHGAPGLAVRLASDKSLLQEYADIDMALSRLTDEPELFERLKAAAAIAKDTDHQVAYRERLHHVVRRLSPGDQLASRLVAVERLRLRLASNVNLKTSFEAFAVEVAW